jgi:homogentisate 1,2-dioxygenase
MVPHGPDSKSFISASQVDLIPNKVDNTLAFMFESRHLLRPSAYAMQSPMLDKHYDECWQDLPDLFKF